MNRISSTFIRSLVCIAIVSAFSASAFAKQYNVPKRLPSFGQSKINKVIAESYLRSNPDIGNRGTSGGGCDSTVGIGNVFTRPGQQAPREVVTVVRGDVINVNRGCR
jgi:hypothetical protein